MYRKSITIDSSQVGGTSDLIDFPALISLTDTDLKHIDNGEHVKDSSGDDIIFRWGQNNMLSHEIEYYDGVNGTLGATGKMGDAIDFDGSNDYNSCGDSATLDVAGQGLTISAWVAPDFTQTGGAMMKWLIKEAAAMKAHKRWAAARRRQPSALGPAVAAGVAAPVGPAVLSA